MGWRRAAQARSADLYRRWALKRQLTTASEILARAWQVVGAQRYCLVVTDGKGGPAARVLEPLRPSADGEIWLGTDPASRKVAQIVRTGRCLLVYQDDRRRACVTLECTARLAGPTEAPRFRRFWRAFWQDGAERDFVNIVCTPTALELWDGLAVVAPDPFGRRTARLERTDGAEWVLVPPLAE